MEGMSTSAPRRAKTTAASTAGSFAEKPQSPPEAGLDGAAIIHPSGEVEYRRDGLRHRDDGPAWIFPDGTQLYYQRGRLHNEFGPAIIYPSGERHYYLNGLRHRDDGPAVEGGGVEEQFWVEGLRYSDGTFSSPWKARA